MGEPHSQVPAQIILEAVEQRERRAGRSTEGAGGWDGLTWGSRDIEHAKFGGTEEPFDLRGGVRFPLPGEIGCGIVFLANEDPRIQQHVHKGISPALAKLQRADEGGAFLQIPVRIAPSKCRLSCTRGCGWRLIMSQQGLVPAWLIWRASCRESVALKTHGGLWSVTVPEPVAHDLAALFAWAC